MSDVSAIGADVRHPSKHPYLWVFESLDQRLKIRHKSMNSFLTSFHRGESERKTLWKQMSASNA